MHSSQLFGLTTAALLGAASAASAAAAAAAAAAASPTSTASAGLNAILGTGNSTTRAACACSQLSAKYGADAVLYPSAANYTAEVTDYWDIRADLLPACVFLPADADAVAAGVSVFASCQAQFAVRGGGHMNFPGSNNIDGGVLMALEHLDTITVDAANRTFNVGPGNRWVDVYTALAPHGLYCIGGRMKTIGVPGLTLIGGFHYLINKYGFAMDNVLAYDVVLGNGTRVTATAATHPDLFWALKGGANNFGVVTQFTMRALPIPQVSTTIQTFDEAAVPAFLQAASDLVEFQGSDVAAGQILSVQFNASTSVISASVLGVQEGTESPPSSFANFSAIPSTLTVNKVMAPVDWHSSLDSPNQLFRVQFAHGTMRPNATQLQFIYETWKAAVEEVLDVPGLYPTFVVNTMPRGAMSVGKNNGVGNVWGLDDTEPLLIWQFSTGWDNAEDDLRMTNWAYKTHDYLHSLNRELGLASEFLYMGDAGEFQNPIATFPLENVQRMREVRTAYDPAGVFTRLNWGGFKLGL